MRVRTVGQAEGEVRVRPCGLWRPCLPPPWACLQPHLQTILSLFIMFQLDRLFCSSNPRAYSCHWALCVCHVPPASSAWPGSMHLQLFLSFQCEFRSTCLRDLPWPPPHPLSHQGKHLCLSSLCHWLLPGSLLFVYWLRMSSSVKWLDLLFCFWFTRCEPESLTHWRNETHVY